MIKVIAFDLVGVLVREKDIEMTNIEEQIERLFGPNMSDFEYLEKAKEIYLGDIILDMVLNFMISLSLCIFRHKKKT